MRCRQRTSYPPGASRVERTPAKESAASGCSTVKTLFVLVRGAHETAQPLVNPRFAEFLGECCLDAVQRRSEDIWGKPATGADAQPEVCVRDEVLLQHELHCDRVVKPLALEGQFGQALAQAARALSSDPDVI